MADDEYNKKLESLQQYIPFLNNMIVQLKDPRKKNREQQLQKMVSLHSMITDKKKKLKLETLIKCEDVILKLYDKVKTGVQGGQQPPHHHSLQLPKPASSLPTPRSPSPSRDLPKTKPVVIPTEKVANRNYNPAASSSSKPKIDVYGSAGDSLIRQRPNASKTSVFERLGYRRPDMSKPPISLEDLEALKADINAAVNSPPVQDPNNMSLYELTDLREKLQKQLKSDDGGPKSINTTIRNTTILTKKAVDKSPIRSPSDKSPIRAPDPKSPIKKPIETSKPLSDFEKALLETKVLVEKKLAATKKTTEKLVPEEIVVVFTKGVERTEIRPLTSETAKKPLKLEFNNEVRKTKTTKVLKEPASIFGSALSSIDNKILVGTKKKEERRNSTKEERPGIVTKDKKDDRRSSTSKEVKEEKPSLGSKMKKDERNVTGKETKAKEKEEKRPESSQKMKEKTDCKDRRDLKKNDEKRTLDSRPHKFSDNTDKLKNIKNDHAEQKREVKPIADKPKINFGEKKKEDKPKVAEEKVKEVPTFKRLADKYNPKPRKPSVDNPLPSEIVRSTPIPFLDGSLSYKSPPQTIVKPVGSISPPKPIPPPKPVPPPTRSNLISVPIMSSPLSKTVEKEVKKPEHIPVQITNILSNPKTNAMVDTVVNQFKGRQTPSILHNQNNFGNNFQSFQPNDNLLFNQSHNNFQMQQQVPNQSHVPMQQHVPMPQPVMSPHIPVQHVPMHPQQQHYQNSTSLAPRPRPFTPFEPIAEPQFVSTNQVETPIQEYYAPPTARPMTPNPFAHHPILSPPPPAADRPARRHEETGYYDDWRRESGETRRPRDYRETTRDPREALRISREAGRDSRDSRESRDSRDPREVARDSRDPREASRETLRDRDPRLQRDPRRSYPESRSYQDDYRSRDVPYEREGRSKVRDPRVNRYSSSSSRYYWSRGRSRSRSREKEGNFMSPLDSLYSGGDPYKKTGKGYGVQGFRIPKVKKETENDNKVENDDKAYEQISDGSGSPEMVEETTNVTSSTECEERPKEDNKTVEKNEKVETEEISSTKEVPEVELHDDVKPNNETDTIEAFLSKLLQNDETRAAASKFIENVSGSLTDERLKQMVQTIKAIQPSKDEVESVTETKEDEKLQSSPTVQIKKMPVRGRGKKRRKKIVYVEEKAESEETCDEDKDQVVVSVGERIKERRRLADIAKAKVKRPKAKAKTELDLLHADIQEMFIRDGVLTATGKRLCNIWHNDQAGSKTTTRNDTRTRRGKAEKFDGNTDKLRVMSNVRVLIPKISVANLNSSSETGDEDGKRYSLRSSKSTSYAENSDEEKRDAKRTEVVEKEPEPEPEPEKESEPVKHKVTKVKKRGHGWASGVLPKRKKVEKHSVSEDKSDDAEAADKSLELVEPDKNYYVIKPWLTKFPCKLCDFNNKAVILHYKSEHPDSEVLVSRLSPAVAEQAIQESTEKNLEECEDVPIPFVRNVSFQCRFCNIVMFCRPSYFYDHITIHTGEYRHFCEHCPFMTANGKRIRLHQRTVHNGDRTIKEDIIKTRIYGYICIECNYVQLDKKAVENHINIYHLGEGNKVRKIAMSTCLEEADVEEAPPSVESPSTKRTIDDEKKQPEAKKARIEEESEEEEATEADTTTEIDEPPVEPPQVVKKEREIDMTVFTCNTDIHEENEKIEQERLKTMTELNDCVKTNRQSLNFVDELSNRLSNSLMRKSPELAAVKMEPVDDEPEEEVYEKIAVEETTTKMTQPPTEPHTASVEVVQKNNTLITGMIQKLQGKLKEETEDRERYSSVEEPPPLSMFDDKVPEQSVNSLMAGYINITKDGGDQVYECRAADCVVTSRNRDEFLRHLREDHATFVEDVTKCLVCQEEISAASQPLLVTLFEHIEQNHENLVEVQRKILKPRRLSGDLLSRTPDPEAASVEEVAPTMAEIVAPPADDDDNPFPFKIAGVMSLAEDPLPPLSPITEKKAPASPSKASILESIVLKETRLSAVEKTITWKSPEAYKKFLQCTRELYKCPQFFCKFATNWRHLFESHIKAHAQRNDELVACVYCDIKTPLSQSGLHIDLRHINCLFSCSQCLYRAVKREYVMVHMKTKHKDGIFMVVALPPKTFKAFMMSGPKNFTVKEACPPYKCGQAWCSSQFLFQDEFMQHVKTAHNGVICCGYKTSKFSCSYKCVIPESMFDHWLDHKCFPYHCLICKFGAIELYSMLEHYSTDHPNQEPRVVDRSKAVGDRVKAVQNCFYNDEALAQIRDVNEDIFKSINAQLFTVTGSEPKKLKREVAMMPLTIVPKPPADAKIVTIYPSQTAIIPPNLQLITTSPKKVVVATPPPPPPPPPVVVEQPTPSSSFVEPEFVAEEPMMSEEDNRESSDPLSLDNEAGQGTGDESDSQEINETKTFGLMGYQLYRCAFCEVSFSKSQDLKAHCVSSKKCSDGDNKATPLKCVHCEKRFRTAHRLIDHIQYHGPLRFSCSLCVRKFPSCFALKGHMRLKHSVTNTVVTPLIPNKNNADNDEFVLRPKPLGDSDIGQDGVTVFSPSEIDSLPKRYIFNSDIRCALCNFSTKVRTNLVRHLQLHSADKSVPDTAPVNPVPCLDKNEKMFDKMTNLAISSFTGANAGRMGGPKPEPKAVEDAAEVPGYVPSHRRYVCCASGCNYICPEESNLRHHLFALHAAESSFTCVHCKSQLKSDVDAFMKHLKLHDTRLYKCSACVFVHNLRHKVERHSAEKHPDTPSQIITVRCVEPESLESEPSTSSSVVTAAASGSGGGGGSETGSKRPWCCGMCKCRSVTKNDMISHIENKHDINTQFKCTLCSYKTNEKETFEEHFKESHPDNEIDIIHVFYEKDSVKPGIPEKSFDTTPLWQRDRPRVRHIRGILFEEGSTPASTKLPKKLGRPTATTNLDLAIDAVAKGIDDTGKGVDDSVKSVDDTVESSKTTSDDIFKMINEQIKDVEEVDGPVITIDDDDDESLVDETTTTTQQDGGDDGAELPVVKQEKREDGALIIDMEQRDVEEERKKLSEAYLLEKFKKYILPHKQAYRCPVCNKFKTRKIPHLVHHIMTEEKRNRFSCQSCDFACVAFDAMKAHTATHGGASEGSVGVTSLIVDPTFIYWLQLLIQYQSRALLEALPPTEGSDSATVTNKSVCVYCKRWFKNFHAIKEHELSHWSQHSYTCNDCDTEFFSIDEFFEHSYTQHSVYSLKINGPSVEKILEKLKTPLTSQAGPSQTPNVGGELPKIYLCFYCMESKVTMEELNEHWKESHQADNVTFNFKVVAKTKVETLACCTYCHEKGSEEQLKKHHNETHQGLKFSTYQFICLECSSTFRNVKELRNHFSKIHVGKKLIYSSIENKPSTAHDRYICPKCPFRSASTGGIRAHVRKHLRPIDCKLCGATYVHPTEARMHHNKEHMHNPEAFEENKERLREYEAIIKKIIGQKGDNNSEKSPPPPPVKQRVVARKSTGAPFKQPEEFSYYGTAKEIVDLKNISASIEVNKVNTRISAEQFSNIFNIFPVVEVEDCAKRDS